MDSPKDVPIIPHSFTPLASLREQYKSDASVRDHECDECYDCNDDKDECIAEETPLGESCGMLVHKVFPPCLELIEYIFPNPLDLIPTSLVHHPLLLPSIILLGSRTIM